ncbi:adenosylcobinamide-phosphate synthase CbiB [Pseudobutyrivibrio sp. MD2005]|uniref:adenosylcobinamide-phosphate synthase CbiB n=1 Tax=Pseudobutyrivibrio sp. MD2005 TaxID=1410616 RepID=UPI000485FCFD|nr:adenosylcobinamide-phosphate synthase CbiB [Pseudobutyrivibrio sp. MD2005]
MIYHLTAFILGYLLDLFLGDPFGSFHPVVWIGNLISRLTKGLLKPNDEEKTKQYKGLLLVVIVITVSASITALFLWFLYTINSKIGIIIEAVITYQCLATKSLYKESMKVFYALKNEGLTAGRKAVSMIVGRDTEALDETGVIKAAVETVAENASDGVIAPLIYLAIGGPVLGIVYKAINTMDSMIGYKDEKYLSFGRYAAKLDDIVNFIPARISAILMILSCAFLGKDYNGKNAYRIFKRDRFNHASPNSAQTESVCAGALSIQLAGPASYFGKRYEKPFIGDKLRDVELMDIRRANRLMILTSLLCELISIVVIIIFVFMF